MRSSSAVNREEISQTGLVSPASRPSQPRRACSAALIRSYSVRLDLGSLLESGKGRGGLGDVARFRGEVQSRQDVGPAVHATATSVCRSSTGGRIAPCQFRAIWMKGSTCGLI